MLHAIAIMPSAPVMVPELAGAAAAELTELRAAVFTAAESLPDRWVTVGTGPVDMVFGPDSVGTFGGFGVDLTVRLSAGAGTPSQLPLCALMAGWVRGRVQPAARVWVHTCADADAAAVRGERLRAEIDRSPEPIGVLVVADGANTLTPAAPGGYRPTDATVQRDLDDALARGDVAALAGLPAQVVGRSAFAALAGLVGLSRSNPRTAPRSAEELYRGAPYGVGYFAGVWQL